MADRLDAFLSHCGYGTRSEVRTMIHHGAVKVNGRTIREHGHRFVDGDRVTVKGTVVVVPPSEATLLLHKPLGHACSHDPAEAPLVDELIPPDLQHLVLNTAGRLDRDTSGLLVLTTDGPLIHRLTHPKRHLVKRYRVVYSGALSGRAVERVAKGLVLEGDPEPTLPAALELEGVDAEGFGRATIHLAEGRYHQVRRMFATLGGTVERLHRDRIGSLELPADLPRGAVRPLSAAELTALTTPPQDLAWPPVA